MKTKTILLSTLLLLGANSYSQNESSIHTTIAIPVLNFGDGQITDFLSSVALPADEFGYASTGLGLGYNYARSLNEKGLFLTAGIDFYWNPIKSKVKDQYEPESDGTHEYTFPNYFNIPLSVGLGFRKPVNDKLQLGASVSPLVNFLKVSKSYHIHYFTGSLGDYSSVKTTYSFGRSLGIRLEGNAIINKRWILGIGYSLHGKHNFQKFRHEVSTYDESENTSDLTKSVSLATIKLGLIITNK